MKAITNKVSTTYQNVFYSILVLCWVTGVAFFVLDTWFKVEGEFGPQKHFLLIPSLEIHAATSFLIMVFFGAFFFGHFPRTKKRKYAQKSGWTMLIGLGYLIFSAYLLYYLGDETMRLYAMYSHLVLGFLLPGVLVLHLRSHHKNKSKRKKNNM